jgi:hypothetical protein
MTERTGDIHKHQGVDVAKRLYDRDVHVHLTGKSPDLPGNRTNKTRGSIRVGMPYPVGRRAVFIHLSSRDTAGRGRR